MAEKFINIRFPFSDDNKKGYFLEMNKNSDDAIKSDLVHLLLTTRGERLYLPDFGTNLRSFLFEPNLEEVRGNIREDIEDTVSKFIPNLRITELTVGIPENGDSSITEHTAEVKVDYIVTQGAFQKADFVTLTI